MCSRVQSAGPISDVDSPVSSSSSRRIASSGSRRGSIPPPGVAQTVSPGKLEADEQDAVVRVEHDRAGRRTDAELAHALCHERPQRAEPAQPLVPRHGRVCRRRRRKHEERRLAEPAFLEAVLRALAERAAVRLLADERDHARPQLAREPLEPLGAAGEVAGCAGRRSRASCGRPRS